MDKNTISKMRSIKRRSFFTRLLKGAAGLYLINLLPFRLFAAVNPKQKRIKVTIHPLAVKRNKRDLS